MSIPEKNHRWAVVLAGGDGTRLRELSHRVSGDARPKQFCEFFGGKSLLAHTRERIAPIFQSDRTLYALARAHRPFYQKELAGVHDRHRIIQPENRGTAVAMAVGLHRIVQHDQDAVVAFFPSDHHYANGSAFHASLQACLAIIEEYPESILLLGAEARYPEVEYGWIEPGRTLVESRTNPLQRVARFWEKPTTDRAERLHRRGCLWNTFVTIGLAGTFLELLRATVPELMQSVKMSSDGCQLDELYNSIGPVDFSKSVLARIPERLIVLRDSASGWTDLGSPNRVVDVLSRHSTMPAWLVPSAVGVM